MKIHFGRKDGSPTRAYKLAATALASLSLGAALLVPGVAAHADPLTTATLCTPGPTPSVSVADTHVAESHGTAYVYVGLSNRSCTTVSVQSWTKAASACAGCDFKPAGQVITFKPGETSKFLAIEIYQDDIKEGDETFEVLLTFTWGDVTIADGFATVTIHDV